MLTKCCKILRSADISYVKWDMNRQLTDLGSIYLDSEQQGELYHRYVLGVYELQERLVTEFPNLLLENCSGGGAVLIRECFTTVRRFGALMIRMRLSGFRFRRVRRLFIRCRVWVPMSVIVQTIQSAEQRRLQQEVTWRLQAHLVMSLILQKFLRMTEMR